MNTSGRLFHDDLHVVSLGSGSKGNSTYIGNGRTGLLVDAGISTRQILARLDAVGLGGAPIDAVLVTHEHTDHIGSLGVLDRRIFKETGRHIPFFMSKGTDQGLPRNVRPTTITHVSAGQPFRWHGWTLEPWAIPHDTVEPLAWAVEVDDKRVGVLTDLGHVPRSLKLLLASLDAAVLEFNHDETLLMEGSYPWSLKQRIRGRRGHLSNRQAAALLASIDGARLQHVILAHLSEENNSPELALAAADEALRAAGATGVSVQLAEQRRGIGPFTVAARVHGLS